MSNRRDADLQALLRAVLSEDELPEPEPEAESPFARQVGAAIGEAIARMRSGGLIEVADGSVDSLIAEATDAGLDARSPKHLVKKVIRTLLESEYVEEVFGSDDEIAAALRGVLDPG